MQLYYFETPNARKPCAVARHTGAPVEFVLIDLTKGQHKTPEFLAINPNGKIPALRDGDTHVWESCAIMCYLAQKTGSDLWPSDPAQQVEVLRWMQWDTAHFSRHAQAFVFQHMIKPAFGLGDPDEAALEEATGFLHQFAGVLDNHLKGRGSLVGDGLTIADFAVASALPYAEKAKMPLSGYTEINRWHDAMMTLPAWRDPFPSELAKSA